MSPSQGLMHHLRNFLIAPILENLENRHAEFTVSDPSSQLALKLAYGQLANSGQNLPRWDEVGFKLFSQTDEDGLLLFIFAVIGATNRKCVEICAGNGIECNTANLIINHGWTGLLVDGNADLVRQGQDFYRTHKATYVYPPTFVHTWVKRDSVNKLLRDYGFKGEVDLLSVDMDGVDYWIWDAIDAIAPRVVVIEYQDIIGPDKTLTVPYSDDFNAQHYPTTRGLPNFCGASLAALAKLGRQKGYRLVGCSRYCVNAFFIRKDIGEKAIPEIPVSECFKHPKVIWGMRKRFPIVQGLPWVEV